MPDVRVKSKYQVTLPTSVRNQVGIAIGDILEAKVESGRITLIPKTVVDRDVAEGLEDFKKGRSLGPFETAEVAVMELHKAAGHGE